MSNFFHLLFVEYIIYKIAKPCITYGIQKYKYFKQNKIQEGIKILNQKIKIQKKKLNFLNGLKLGIGFYKFIQKTFIVLICVQIYDRTIIKKIYNDL